MGPGETEKPIKVKENKNEIEQILAQARFKRKERKGEFISAHGHSGSVYHPGGMDARIRHPRSNMGPGISMGPSGEMLPLMRT